MVNTNSELNNNKALNTYRLMGIFSQFEINEEIKNALSERLSEDKLFNLFCNKYSKLHGKTKQVKKEFLLVLAYSMKDNFTISDYTNFQQQFDDASSIETVKNGLDILEKISNMTPDGIVKDVIGVPFFDGSSLIKNITFSMAEYTNVANVKDIVDTIESNGHVELNSIIKSATDNKKLFYAYMSEMHKKEDSFIHNYIPKGHPITEVDVGNNFDNLLKELKITKVLYEKLSPYNKEISFFCETNDLINIINKSVFYLRLNKDNLLNEKDKQFQPKVFAHYHHRTGVEIMKKCLNGEYEKLDDFLQNIPQNTRKSFLDHISKNYNDHVQIIHEFYYSQTKKNINKTSSIKPIIDFFSIKNSLTHANNHLISLKDYVLSDINMEESNLKNIEQIENNINLLIHNLKIYNEKASTYKENSKLLNQALSGNFKYSLPTKLQISEIVDMDGKPIKEKSFNDLFNETSNLYQNLLTGNSFLKNERQVNLIMLSKANFETFKASGRFEEFVLTTNNKIKMMMEENIDDKKKMILKGISEQLRYLMNKNDGLSENDLLGISANSIGVALTVKSLGADITSFKVIDATSNLLTTVKEMVLNKNIYHNIDETFLNIYDDNKKIIKNMWIKKRDAEEENNKIAIKKIKEPEEISTVQMVRDSVKKSLAFYNDKELDERVSNHVKNLFR